MGGSKAAVHQPGVYRDDPDRDDAASTSSAVLLEDIEYPEDELPPYTDEPAPTLEAESLPAPFSTQNQAAFARHNNA